MLHKDEIGIQTLFSRSILQMPWIFFLLFFSSQNQNKMTSSELTKTIHFLYRETPRTPWYVFHTAKDN